MKPIPLVRAFDPVVVRDADPVSAEIDYRLDVLGRLDMCRRQERRFQGSSDINGYHDARRAREEMEAIARGEKIDRLMTGETMDPPLIGEEWDLLGEKPFSEADALSVVERVVRQKLSTDGSSAQPASEIKAVMAHAST